MAQYWPFSGLIRAGALRERLVVSLDHGGMRDSLRLVDALAGTVGMFKVGRHLFLNGGPDFVRDLRRRGVEVFLDLKFHDPPQAVCKAAIEATRLSARMFDLHCNGGADAAARVRAEVTRVCRHEGLRKPHVLAVAMLTGLSHVDADQAEGCGPDGVVRLAKLAADASLDGVVTSVQVVDRVRATCGRRFIVVTSPSARRRSTGDLAGIGAADALRAGADYLVVGAPIWNAADPRSAARDILAEMERGLRANPRGPIELLSSRPN